MTRHLCFWALFSIHFIIQNLMIGGPGEARTFRTFGESAINLLYFLPVFVISTTVFLEFLLPVFLFRGRYITFGFSVFLLAGSVIIAAYYSGLFYIHREWGLPFDRITFLMNKYHTLVNGFFVPLMIWCIGGGFKLAREWFMRQRENEKLAQQRIATEIKLLKTQIHPRFLFQTLGSVQKQVQSVDTDAPALVLHLSDILSYLLYESDRPAASLEKEVEIVRSYIALQVAGDASRQRQFELKTAGIGANQAVPPLLLLTIVEKCFEFFFDSNPGAPDGFLEVNVHEDELTIHLDCAVFEDAGNRKFVNDHAAVMQQQVQRLYPGLIQRHFQVNEFGFSMGWAIPFIIEREVEPKYQSVSI